MNYRHIRVFISSTFKGMEIERKYLMEHIFPKLVFEGSKRHVIVTPLDLRWGITQEASERGEVIKACLQEIKNSHPFFIGILGDRYGWTPTLDDIKKDPDTLLLYPWIQNDVVREGGISMTEIEMQYGVLREKEKQNAYFYVNKKANIIDNRQINLLSQIENDGRYPVVGYNNIEELGNCVESDFIKLLDELYPLQKLSRFKEEESRQKHIVNLLSDTVFGRDIEIQRINTFVNSSNNSLCIIGKPGVGKSAVLAKWIKDHELDYNVIYYFPKDAQEKKECEYVQKYFIDQIAHITGKSYDASNDEATLYDTLLNAIVELNEYGKSILIIDGIEQIVKKGEIDYDLTWLPIFSKEVKVIVSCRDTGYKNILTQRNFCDYEVNVLDFQYRLQLAKSKLQMSGKSKGLTDSQYRIIVDNDKSENLRVLELALTEMTYNCVIESLPSFIEEYEQANTVYDFKTGIVNRMLDKYNNQFLESVFQILLCTHCGVAETDLLSLVGINPLEWSRLYCSYYLIFQNVEGLISIKDPDFIKILSDKYLDFEKEFLVRNKIVNYFSKRLTTIRETDNKPNADEMLSYFKRKLGGNMSDNDIETYTKQWLLSEKMYLGKEILFKELLYQFNRTKDWDNQYKLLLDPTLIVYYERNHCELIYKYWDRIQHIDKKYKFTDAGVKLHEQYYTYEFLSDFYYSMCVLSGLGLADDSFSIEYIKKSIEYLEKADPVYKKMLSYQRYERYASLSNDLELLLNTILQLDANSEYEQYAKAISINNVAQMYVNQDRFQDAIDLLLRNDVISLTSNLTEIEKRTVQAKRLQVLADAHAQIEQPQISISEIREMYLESVEDYKQLFLSNKSKYFVDYISTCHNYAMFCYEQNDIQESIRLLSEVKKLVESSDNWLKKTDWANYARVLSTYGGILTDYGEHISEHQYMIEAKYILRYAVDILKNDFFQQSTEYVKIYVDTLHNYARAIRKSNPTDNDIISAYHYYQESANIYSRIKDIEGEIKSYSGLGLIDEEKGNYAVAAKNYRYAIYKIENKCEFTDNNIQKLQILYNKVLDCLRNAEDVDGLVLIIKKMICMYYRLYGITNDSKCLDNCKTYSNFLNQNGIYFPQEEWEIPINII